MELNVNEDSSIIILTSIDAQINNLNESHMVFNPVCSDSNNFEQNMIVQSSEIPSAGIECTLSTSHDEEFYKESIISMPSNIDVFDNILETTSIEVKILERDSIGQGDVSSKVIKSCKFNRDSESPVLDYYELLPSSIPNNKNVFKVFSTISTCICKDVCEFLNLNSANKIFESIQKDYPTFKIEESTAGLNIDVENLLALQILEKILLDELDAKGYSSKSNDNSIIQNLKISNLLPKNFVVKEENLFASESFKDVSYLNLTDDSTMIEKIEVVDEISQEEDMKFNEEIEYALEESLFQPVETIISNCNKNVESVKSEINVKKRKKLSNLKILKCVQCSYTSSRSNQFNQHLKIHEKQSNIFRCERCDFSCIRKSVLTLHMLSHPELILSCSHCSYKCVVLKAMKKHIHQKHKNIPSIGNDIENNRSASENFISGTDAKRLVDSVTKSDLKKSVSCTKCSFTTMQKCHYNRHMRTVHNNCYSHLCDLCGAKFKTFNSLKQHYVAIHFKPNEQRVEDYLVDNVHSCDICNKICRSAANLKEHKLTHSEKRSFLCEICGAAFKTRSVQRSHIATVHNKMHLFNCYICGKKFSTRFNLKRHINKHKTQCIIHESFPFSQDLQGKVLV